MSHRYSTTDGNLVKREHSSKARALAAAKDLPGLVRVATPAGNLVKYVDNRPQSRSWCSCRPGSPCSTCTDG